MQPKGREMKDAATSGAGALIAGAGGEAMSLFGMEAAPLFWALVGASLGVTFAAAATRARATVVFVTVVLSCSLFGAWLAHRYLGGESISRNALACGLAIFFHPLLNAAVTRVPEAVDSLMRRFGIGRSV